MYYPDLYVEERPYGVNAIKVGWLDKGKPYTKMEDSDFNKLANLILKLEEIGPSVYTKGWHNCPFCGNHKSSTQFQIRLKGGKTFYDAPEMIIHYIIDHEYLPPQEFIDAVMNYKK
jgi:hypothetical protein